MELQSKLITSIFYFLLQDYQIKGRMNKPFYGAASITNSKRSQLINLDNSHGPAMYDVSKDKYNTLSPKWTLKPRLDYGSCFKINKQNRPPPGSYQISQDIKHKVTLKNPNFRSQKYKSSTQKLAHLSDLNMPSSINTKSGISFGYRDQLLTFKQTNYSPGPIYHPLKNLQQSRQAKIKNNCKGFGYGQRNAIYKTNQGIPGPGAYFDQDKQNKKYQHSPSNSTFGKSPRNVRHLTSPLGPGQYSPKILNNGSPLLHQQKGFKLKGKLPEAQKYVNPNGPGSYDLPQTKSSIGPRFNHYRHKSNVDQNQLPSPFTYDYPRYPQMIDQRKGFSLGKKINSVQNFATIKNPGPGSYQVSQNISTTKAGGYMGRKMLRKKKTTQQDCFGKYDPKLSASARSGPKYSFANDAKPWNKTMKDETLGPAHYGYRQKKWIQSYSMGTSQRFKQMKKQRGYISQQSENMNSTIGYLPSYLKKEKSVQKKNIDNNS